MTGPQEAAAARRSARGENLVRSLGSETFTFEPEVPLDIVLALDTLNVASDAETRAWMVAHLVVDTPCDAGCADDGADLRGRKCAAEKAMRVRLRKVRVDGRRLGHAEFHEFYESVLGTYAVSEGESDSSAESSGAAGELSSVTAPEPEPTAAPSGGEAAAEPTGSAS